jgi:hypothetical protein
MCLSKFSLFAKQHPNDLSKKITQRLCQGMFYGAEIQKWANGRRQPAGSGRSSLSNQPDDAGRSPYPKTKCRFGLTTGTICLGRSRHWREGILTSRKRKRRPVRRLRFRLVKEAIRHLHCKRGTSKSVVLIARTTPW